MIKSIRRHGFGYVPTRAYTVLPNENSHRQTRPGRQPGQRRFRPDPKRRAIDSSATVRVTGKLGQIDKIGRSALGKWWKAPSSGDRSRYRHGFSCSAVKRDSWGHHKTPESQGSWGSTTSSFRCGSTHATVQDEDEDWSRWRDVIFKAKGTLAPRDMKIKAAPPQNRRKRGGPAVVEGPEIPSMQFTNEEVVTRIGDPASTERTSESLVHLDENGHQYCPECYLPLHPDPKPEKLYIFLHALRYTTSLGSFETEMPDWAAEGWTWNRD